LFLWLKERGAQVPFFYLYFFTSFKKNTGFHGNFMSAPQTQPLLKITILSKKLTTYYNFYATFGSLIAYQSKG
jgi:hypothetical protein